MSGPALAVGTDGDLRVLWCSGGSEGETGLYWSESRDGGRTFAPRKLLSSGQASGTPLLLSGEGNTLTSVWGMGGGGSSHLMTAKGDAEGHITEDMVAMSSELPSAATVGGKLFVAYISKSGKRRGVWLTRA